MGPDTIYSVTYYYLDNTDPSAVVFEAIGKSIPEMFMAAANAMTRVMVENIDDLSQAHCQKVFIKEESLESLLFQLLQEFLYLKSAEQLLLRLEDVTVCRENDFYTLTGKACGDVMDQDKHQLKKNVQAVVMHLLKITETSQGWKAAVVLRV